MAPFFTGLAKNLGGFGFGKKSSGDSAPSGPQLNFVYFYSSGSWTVPDDSFSATEGGSAGFVNVLVVAGGGGAGFNAAAAGGGRGKKWLSAGCPGGGGRGGC